MVDGADHQRVNRHDTIERPTVKPVVTRVELHAGHCQARGATTMAPLPEGLEQGRPFSIDIVARALDPRDRQLANAAGDAVFAPRLKMPLSWVFVIARRRHHLAETTRCQYRRRLGREPDALMALAPANPDGKRPRKRTVCV